MILVCSFIKLGENCFHPWGLNHVQPFYRNCFNFQYKMYLFERLFPTTENIRIFNFLVFIRARICICKTLSALPLELRWIFPLQDRVKFTAALSPCKQSLPSLLIFWDSVIKRTVLKQYLMMAIKGPLFLLVFNCNIFSSKLYHEHSWKKTNMTSHFVIINHLLCKFRCLQDFRVQGLPAHGACTNNERFTMRVISTFRKRSITNESRKGYR